MAAPPAAKEVANSAGIGGNQGEGPKPSFVQIIGKILVEGSDDSPVEGTRFRKEGDPAIGITTSNESRGETFMKKHVIVLKFSSYRPTLEDICDSINRTWRIMGDFSMGLLDQRHVVVRLQSEAEAKKVLSRDSFLIRGVRFKAFCWHYGFSLKADPITVPLWVELPNFPLHLFHPPLLKAIVENSFEDYLRMDDYTRCLTRPGVAHLCVEMSLAEKLPTRVWIDRANKGGFWQKIEYPGFKYCENYAMIGHQDSYCMRLLGRSISKPAEKGKKKMESKPVKQVYVPMVQKMKDSKEGIGTSGAKNSHGIGIPDGEEENKLVGEETRNIKLANKYEALVEDKSRNLDLIWCVMLLKN